MSDELKLVDQIKSCHGRGLRFSVEYNTNDNTNFSKKLYFRMKEKYRILLDIKWHRAGFRPSFLVDKKTADFVIDSFSKEIKELSKKFKSRKYFWSFYKKET